MKITLRVMWALMFASAGSLAASYGDVVKGLGGSDAGSRTEALESLVEMARAQRGQEAAGEARRLVPILCHLAAQGTPVEAERASLVLTMIEWPEDIEWGTSADDLGRALFSSEASVRESVLTVVARHEGLWSPLTPTLIKRASVGDAFGLRCLGLLEAMPAAYRDASQYVRARREGRAAHLRSVAGMMTSGDAVAERRGWSAALDDVSLVAEFPSWDVGLRSAVTSGLTDDDAKIRRMARVLVGDIAQVHQQQLTAEQLLWLREAVRSSFRSADDTEREHLGCLWLQIATGSEVSMLEDLLRENVDVEHCLRSRGMPSPRSGYLVLLEESADVEVRQRALWALARGPKLDEKETKVVIGALRDSSVNVRRVAVYCLGRGDGVGLSQILLQRVVDQGEDLAVRQNAAESALRVAGDAADSVSAALVDVLGNKSENPGLRAWIAGALGRHPDPHGIARAALVRVEKDGIVGVAAEDALKSLGKGGL